MEFCSPTKMKHFTIRYVFSILLLASPSYSTAPVFSNLPAISIPLREDIRVDTSFFQVKATDVDNDTVQFNLVSPSQSPFHIDPVSGIVSVGPGLNFEMTQKYQLHISVNDSTQMITEILTVNIEDVDEAPIFITLPNSIQIPENRVNYLLLPNITAVDPEGENIKYTMVSPLGTPFEITPEGVLTMKKNPNLDFETFQQNTLIIAATDGTRSTLSTFTVDITDVNEPPKILNMGAKITIPQATTGNIFYPFAVDEDFQDEITYTFKTYPNTTGSDLFTLDPLTGGLSVNCKPCLNPEFENLYEIHITATDKDGLNTTGILYVEVVDFMGIPEIWNLPAHRFLFENRTKGEMLFEPRTIDLTEGGRVSYEMQVYPVDGRFIIDTQTGKVSVLDNPGFDYERCKQYGLTIVVSNGVTKSHPAKLYVNIMDTNEPPVITNTLSVFTIRENTVKSALIDKIKAKDSDNGATLTYELSVEPPSGQKQFSINRLNGELDVSPTEHFDYESLNEYRLIVRASDGVLKSQPFSINIHVTDVNEPPSYEKSNQFIEIPEEMAIGEPLSFSCDASDPDVWDKSLLYQLMTSEHSHFFTVENQNGCVVKMAERLDRDDPGYPESIQLEIRAIDWMGLWASLSLTIRVLNINDNSPVFLPKSYEVKLAENARVGQSVLDVQASDKDVGVFGHLSYSIIANPGENYFHVSGSGRVTLRSQFDREDLAKIVFLVRVADTGSPARVDTATVTVTIVDSNDHRPIFIQDFYDFEARSDCSLGTFIGQISASDRDSSGQTLTYKLLGISAEFILDGTSGEVRTSTSLKSDAKYLLQSVVKDDGNPPQTSKAVQIRVDTYTCQQSLIRMEVNEASIHLDSPEGRRRFLKALQLVFPGFKPGLEMIRRGKTQVTSTVTVYFVRNNRTQSAMNVGEKKKFVSVEEIISSTTSDGKPAVRLQTGPFVRFPITAIARECEDPTVNWWLDTDAGKAVMGLLITVGSVLFLAGLGYLGTLLASRYSGFSGFGSPKGSSKVSPPPRGTLGRTQYSRFKDKQNWWRLKPDSHNSSPLQEKLQHSNSRPVSSSEVKLQAAKNNGRPLSGGKTGLEF